MHQENEMVEQIEVEEMQSSENNTSYLEAIMKPEIYPDEVTPYNIDPSCDMKTMFKDEDDKKYFFNALNQTCYLKNSCEINPE